MNNIKGLQPTKKRIKLIEYFKSELNHNGIFSLQEKRSSIKNENTQENDFNGVSVLFSSNSCNVLIAYVGKTSFVLNKQKTDKCVRILDLDVTLYTDQCILINLYNANTETGQAKILE